MLESGRVMEVRGNRAVVKMVRTETCGQCGRCGIFGPKDDIIIEARNDAGAVTGDDVDVEMGSVSLLWAAGMVYIFPLVLAMIGFGVGSYLSNLAGMGDASQGAGILTGFVFLGMAYVILKRYDASLRKKGKINPVIVKVRKHGSLDTELERGGDACGEQ